jgi:hypothetical protein
MKSHIFFGAVIVTLCLVGIYSRLVLPKEAKRLQEKYGHLSNNGKKVKIDFTKVHEGKTGKFHDDMTLLLIFM